MDMYSIYGLILKRMFVLICRPLIIIPDWKHFTNIADPLSIVPVQTMGCYKKVKLDNVTI